MKSLPGHATEPSTLPVSRGRKMMRKVEALAAEATPFDRRARALPPIERIACRRPGRQTAL